MVLVASELSIVSETSQARASELLYSLLNSTKEKTCHMCKYK